MEAPRSLAQLGARLILEQIDRIEANEPGTRSGRDPEHLHKMRVATRRLRVAARVFGKALGAEGIELPVDRVRMLAGALGTVRDVDVFAAALTAEATAQPAEDAAALDRLRRDRLEQRRPLRRALVEVLDGGAVADLTGELRTQLRACAGVAATTPTTAVAPGAPPAPATAGVPAGTGTGGLERRARKILRRALRRLRAAGKDLHVPTSVQLHQLRIEAKRARYTFEFFAPVFGDALAPCVAAARSIQDALGVVQDADVATEALLHDIERLASSARRAPDAAALARLIGRCRARREEAIERFRVCWAALPDLASLREKLDAQAGTAPAEAAGVGDGAAAGTIQGESAWLPKTGQSTAA